MLMTIAFSTVEVIGAAVILFLIVITIIRFAQR
jgi:hypothetical protein